MAGTKNNRRTLYTKRVIREEFLALLQVKPLAKITVKEICVAADINRGTFYNYYTDPYDLFQKIEEDLIQEVLSTIKINERALDTWLVKILTVLVENKDVSTIILSSRNDSKLLSSVLERVKPQSLENFTHIFEDTSDDNLDLYFTYFVEGTIGLIEKWLKHYSHLSPDEVSRMIVSILSTRIE